MRVFDPHSGQRLAAHRWTEIGRTTRLALGPGGRLLATAAGGMAVRLWDLEAGDLVSMLPHGSAAYVDGLAFSPAGDRLALGTSEGEVLVFDAHTAARLLDLDSGLGPIRCLAFAPDGRRLLAGDSAGRVAILE